MRWIGSLPTASLAQRCIHFLQAMGIQASMDPDTEGKSRIWILQEDDVDRATTLFHEFEADPMNLLYDAPELPLRESHSEGPSGEVLEGEADLIRPRIGWGFLIPLLTLIVCSIFIAQQWQLAALDQGRPSEQVAGLPLLTSIEEELLIQVPENVVALREAVFSLPQHAPGLTPQEINTILTSHPAVIGFFGELKVEWGLLSQPPKAPILPEVRSGEIWRLWTPALMHAHLLHLAFNLLWFLYLGKHIEGRLGASRLFLLLALTALGSNLAQYIMSGPMFYGLSGVACGMAGFIWIRQKKAPWEGYPIPRATLNFLAGFVVLMILFDGMFLLLEIVRGPFEIGFSLANTAHVVGALVGMALGTLPCMGKRRHL